MDTRSSSFWNLWIRRGCRRRGRFAGTAGARGREEAEAEFGAEGGVGAGASRPLQVGRVLNGQQPVIQIIRGAVAGASAAGGVHLGVFLHIVGAVGRGDGGIQRGGIGGNPAFGLQGGGVVRLLRGGQLDAGALEDGGKAGGFVDAHLKFVAQFHVVALKNFFGGVAQVGGAGGQDDELGILFGGQGAGGAGQSFLRGVLIAHLFDERPRGGNKPVRQPGGQRGGAGLGGGYNGVAILQQQGQREVEVQGITHNQSLVDG